MLDLYHATRDDLIRFLLDQLAERDRQVARKAHEIAGLRQAVVRLTERIGTLTASPDADAPGTGRRTAVRTQDKCRARSCAVFPEGARRDAGCLKISRRRSKWQIGQVMTGRQSKIRRRRLGAGGHKALPYRYRRMLAYSLSARFQFQMFQKYSTKVSSKAMLSIRRRLLMAV